jgi:hypothetical protein
MKITKFRLKQIIREELEPGVWHGPEAEAERHRLLFSDQYEDEGPPLDPEKAAELAAVFGGGEEEEDLDPGLSADEERAAELGRMYSDDQEPSWWDKNIGSYLPWYSAPARDPDDLEESKKMKIKKIQLEQENNMKISKKQLNKIIREEVDAVLREQTLQGSTSPGGGIKTIDGKKYWVTTMTNADGTVSAQGQAPFRGNVGAAKTAAESKARTALAAKMKGQQKPAAKPAAPAAKPAAKWSGIPKRTGTYPQQPPAPGQGADPTTLGGGSATPAKPATGGGQVPKPITGKDVPKISTTKVPSASKEKHVPEKGPRSGKIIPQPPGKLHPPKGTYGPSDPGPPVPGDPPASLTPAAQATRAADVKARRERVQARRAKKRGPEAAPAQSFGQARRAARDAGEKYFRYKDKKYGTRGGSGGSGPGNKETDQEWAKALRRAKARSARKAQAG